MKSITRLLLLVLVGSLIFITNGCSTTISSNSEEKYIIDASQAVKLLEQDGVVLVDTQGPEEYGTAHVKGAVNISRNDITINIPVPNMLASKGKMEEVLSSNGISNDTMIIIYDNNNNMDAARLWWTLMVYGHENMKVVSGGLNELKKAGLEDTSEKTIVNRAKYIIDDKRTEFIATLDEVKDQVNDPKNNVVLLDTRNLEEYNEGTIPGSILLDYSLNNFKDGTYKPSDHIKIQYIEVGIKPEKTVIIYCKTSIRGAQTFLALYDAGYRNLKLYDGAWVEWSANSSLPIQTPTGSKIESNQHDNS